MKRKQKKNSLDKRSKKAKVGRKVKSKKGRKGHRELKLDEFYVVPWYDRSEWDSVSENFNDGNFENVIRTINIWRERVPSLPVGVETSLTLLHALLADRNNAPEDQCRSMYSLAVTRFLNHISHVATKEAGANLPIFRLASHMNVPDWIVDLRHEISHGASLPSLDSLRYAAAFIRTWLSQNYWTPWSADLGSESRDGQGPSKEETYERISCAVSSFIASKVYRIRGVKHITDPEITHQLPAQPWSVTPKQAVGGLKTRLMNYFSRTPSLVCSAIANDMVPTTDFLAGFSAIVKTEDLEEVFGQFQALLAPLIELLRRRGKIPQMCTLMAAIHVEEVTKEGKLFSSLWLDLLLSKLEEEEKEYPLRLKKILALVMNSLDTTSVKFLPRLLRLLENKLGSQRVSKLEELINIYTDDAAHEKVRDAPLRIVTVEELTHKEENEQDCLLPDLDSLTHQHSTVELDHNWELDRRGQNYWRQFPLGLDEGRNRE